MKTLVLVCFGSMLFTVAGTWGTEGADPTRAMSQIVSGIGFLAGGCIFLKDEKKEGLTTAATVWTTAAIGAIIGCGRVEVAIWSTIVVLLSIWVIGIFEGVFQSGS